MILITLVLVAVALMVQRQSPFLGGLLAVLPVKSVAVLAVASQTGRDALTQTVQGLLLGQCLWLGALLAIWWWVR
jgi:uncharacterized membrane protein (GlpM family)